MAVQIAVWGFLAAGGAQAAPQSGIVRAGSATISTSGATTTINQSSDRAVVDWSAFSIASGESVVFNQPSSQSAILNRVTGGQVSTLQGSLTANGQVYLVNPNGILIGQGATIDAGSFIATTANIATGDFMASPASANGRYAFDQVTSASSAGSIVNLGTITAADGGLVALVAPAVRNAGVIAAKLGKITLAAANIFTLDLYGDDLVRLAVSDQVAAALTDVSGAPVTAQVNVAGQVSADGGRVVLLSVPAAVGIVDSSINLSGIARAQTLATGQAGEILLLATGGDIKVSGQLDVTGPASGLAGGTIEAFGNHVNVGATARVDASGAAGGGLVALGGTLDYAGNAVQTQTTTVSYGASVTACGTLICGTVGADGSGGTGNGGTVRLYSAQGTELDGTIDVSSGQGAVAGTTEVLSDLGTTTLGTMSQIIAHTGSGNPAGFAVVIGYDLSVASGVLMDMRDYAGNENNSTTHVLYDQANPGLRTYVMSNDADPSSFQPLITTTDPIVFHAYDPAVQATYVAQLPARRDPTNGILAENYTTPVGTLRPDGGAPTTTASAATDPLTPIPVSLTPPSSGGSGGTDSGGGTSGSTGGNGDTGGDAGTGGGGTATGTPLPSAADLPTAVTVAASADEFGPSTDEPSSDTAASSAAPLGNGGVGVKDASAAASTSVPILVGGRGVAQIADLGRTGGSPGAIPNIFAVNYQVIAPTGRSVDAPITDYLCRTPFAGDSCHTRSAHER